MAVPTLTLPEARDEARELATLLQKPVKQQRKDAAQSSARREQLIDTIGEGLLRVDTLLWHLPQSPKEAQEEFATIRLVAQALRDALFLVMEEINPTRAWFWTAEWQAKEREADADYAAGRFQRFASTDELEAAFAAMDADLDARADVGG